MAKCKLCGRPVGGGREYHNKCRLTVLQSDVTVFQLDEIIQIYQTSSDVPMWISDAVKEFSFIYEDNMRERSVFQSAAEVAEQFVIDGKREIHSNDVDQLPRSIRPDREILRVLEKGMLIEIEDGSGSILPGELIQQCAEILERGEELGEWRKARQEMFGFLAIALTRSLIENGRYNPRYALSIPRILTEQILRARDREDKLPDRRFLRATKQLQPYQRNKLRRRMIGWLPSGDEKIIRDVDPFDGTLILKDCMVKYIDRMRERFRERVREERERR